MTTEQLEHHQNERLHWTLTRAFEEVAHYATTFAAAHVTPADFTGPADLAKFPLLSRDELKETPLGLIAVPPTQILRAMYNGVYITGLTYQDVTAQSELVARALFAAGVRAGDKIIIALMGAEATSMQEGAEMLGCSVLRTRDQAAWFGAKYRVAANGLMLRTIPALGGPGIGARTDDGFHVWEDHFYPEIVDGELVMTTIMRQAMPLVRYRTGLKGTLEPGTTYPQFRRFVDRHPR